MLGCGLSQKFQAGRGVEEQPADADPCPRWTPGRIGGKLRASDPALRARVLTNLGRSSYGLGQMQRSHAFFQQALAAATDAESLYRIANAHMALGVSARATGDLQAAIDDLKSEQQVIVTAVKETRGLVLDTSVAQKQDRADLDSLVKAVRRNDRGIDSVGRQLDGIMRDLQRVKTKVGLF